MEPLFKNTTDYTKKEYTEFEKFHINKVHKKSKIIFIILCAIIIIDAILLITIKSYTYGICFLIIGIVFLLLKLFLPYLHVKNIFKSDKITPNIKNNYEFYEDNMKIYNDISSSDIKYEKLYKVYESKDSFYLYTSKFQAFLVSKNCFSIGNSDDFSKFIENKLSENYKKII